MITLKEVLDNQQPPNKLPKYKEWAVNDISVEWISKKEVLIKYRKYDLLTQKQVKVKLTLLDILRGVEIETKIGRVHQKIKAKLIRENIKARKQYKTNERS